MWRESEFPGRSIRLAPLQAVRPGRSQTLGLGCQVIGQAYREVESTAESGDRLPPTPGPKQEPDENRRQRWRVCASGPLLSPH